jgi:hypothetical protein
MTTRRVALLAVLVLGFPSAGAQAPLNPQIEVENHAETDIKELNIKPNGTAEWGENKLGDVPLAPGKSTSIREFTETNCNYQMRAVFQNGRTEEQPIDVCHHSRIVVGAKRPASGRIGGAPKPADRKPNPEVFR